MLIKVITVIERLAETKEPISHGGSFCVTLLLLNPLCHQKGTCLWCLMILNCTFLWSKGCCCFLIEKHCLCCLYLNRCTTDPKKHIYIYIFFFLIQCLPPPADGVAPTCANRMFYIEVSESKLFQDGDILHQCPLKKINTAAPMMDTLLMDSIGSRHPISSSL